MLRAILGVIVGYLATVVVVFATFTGTYMALGADGAFEPDSYEISLSWILISFLLSLVAAVVGGVVCILIARNSKAVLGLAGLILVLGLAFAVPVVMGAEDDWPTKRTADVGYMEAMMNARQPAWVALANPILGTVGVLIGGRLAAKK